MENMKSSVGQEIMPPELFKHYVDGRRQAYATGGEDVYVPDPKIPGFKVFNWKNPNLQYYFEDHYTIPLKCQEFLQGLK